MSVSFVSNLVFREQHSERSENRYITECVYDFQFSI
ncbi:hypothetical protein DFQ00_1282 [Paenibacillus barcinonensis]|uniref:Uncharacterized protein n=1 Tax=Paenibacillus barcinonensis TaxID=198119 RepID=A0A2V4V484_PAEBA|nr:hypothetical protein DFQ00_1282 [Paenibacillus barcinonensis]